MGIRKYNPTTPGRRGPEVGPRPVGMAELVVTCSSPTMFSVGTKGGACRPGSHLARFGVAVCIAVSGRPLLGVQRLTLLALKSPTL